MSVKAEEAHAAIDPDSEIITERVVTPGNAGDASSVAEDLIADLLADDESGHDARNAEESVDLVIGDKIATNERATVYGDNAYGTGELQEQLGSAGIDSRCKTQEPAAPGGLFTKDSFAIDLDKATVTCPQGVTVRIRQLGGGGGVSYFGDACTDCPLRASCTTATGGRTIRISPHEAALARARKAQAEPEWRADYRATRPKVERKLAHLMFRRHGGRRARVRGTDRVDSDFRLLAGAANLARLARLGLGWDDNGWAVA
jgi:hypothetical protein